MALIVINSPKNKIINFQVDKFEKLIGISITANEIDKILSSLGFKCKKSQKAIKVEVYEHERNSASYGE